MLKNDVRPVLWTLLGTQFRSYERGSEFNYLTIWVVSKLTVFTSLVLARGSQSGDL